MRIVQREVEITNLKRPGLLVDGEPDPQSLDQVIKQWAAAHPDAYIMQVKHIPRADGMYDVIMWTEFPESTPSA